jgi:phosphoglycolate phosphatase-like HAD superfamily hydrolase
MARYLVLFDIDGTLVLTGGAGTRAMTRAFTDVLGIADGLAGVSLAGRTDLAIAQEVVARWGRVAEAAPSWLDMFRSRYCECLEEEIELDGSGKRVLPGVPELLDVLASRSDTALALLTGNLEEGARIKLEHFGLWRYFGFGAFGEDVTDRNQLFPLALQRAREQGLPQFEGPAVLVVGDTPYDVACAKSGGARAIGVATGPYSASALRQCGADVVLDDLSDPSAFLALLREV